jgi:glycosyltransferase involved in cell wall biosynthesis
MMSDLRGPHLAYVTTVPSTQFAFLRGQNAYMAAHGLELHAITSPGEALDKLVRRDGVHAHPVRIARTIRPLRDLIACIHLWLVLRRLRPDIVHLSTPKAALLGALAAKAAGVKTRVFLIRGLSSESAAGLRRSIFLQLERLTARLSTHSICVAPSLLDYARRNGIAQDSIVVANGMSNGIDATRFDPGVIGEASEVSELPPRRIGFVGRLVRDKGIEELALAWRSIRDDYPDACLILVGRCEEHDPIDDAIKTALEEDDRVVCTGRIEDVRPWMKSMDVFVYPSRGAEGFPNAPMEAAAMECPVVTTSAVGCVDAVVHNATGLIVPPGDSKRLGEALRYYLDNPEVAKEHGRRGRQRVASEFQREPIWEGLLRFYANALMNGESTGRATCRADHASQTKASSDCRVSPGTH